MTGRDGVLLVAASAVLGALGTLLTGGEPGAVLGCCVVLGTLTAGLTVQPRSSHLVIPVPALAYPVAALISGFLGSQTAGGSRTALALGALQWIARGFPWMAAATLVAGAVAAARWWPFVRRPAPRSSDRW